MSKIVVGKDIIELLGSAMYRDPLCIYREYIQNAVDSIDEAIEFGLLKNATQSNIEINVNNVDRRITIRDNGTGISKRTFKRKMLSIGASGKRDSSARGFRGIGRLSGLGFCQELVFRTRSKGQDVSELKWSIREIKKVLADHNNDADLAKLIEETTEFQSYASDEYPEHFFEVEMIKPLRLGGDTLLNSDKVKNYLSQVAPVPFSDDFSLAAPIKKHIRENGFFKEYNIFLNGSDCPLYKAYTDEITFSETKKGLFTGEIDLISLMDSNDKLSAVGWIAHTDYQGAIPPRSLVGGLRARVGNLQIGERDLFIGAYPEPRFNSWTVGEIHIVDQKIIPNGRRDGFEQNKNLSDLQIHLLPHCHEVARKCRKESSIRNIRKRIDILFEKIEEDLHILKQNVLSVDIEKQKRSFIKGSINEVKSLIPTAELSKPFYKTLMKKLNIIDRELKSSSSRKWATNLSLEEQAYFERFCGLIYDCSKNQSTAKDLIDRIIARL